MAGRRTDQPRPRFFQPGRHCRMRKGACGRSISVMNKTLLLFWCCKPRAGSLAWRRSSSSGEIDTNIASTGIHAARTQVHPLPRCWAVVSGRNRVALPIRRRLGLSASPWLLPRPGSFGNLPHPNSAMPSRAPTVDAVAMVTQASSCRVCASARPCPHTARLTNRVQASPV
jgi:hypothetical protein